MKRMKKTTAGVLALLLALPLALGGCKDTTPPDGGNETETHVRYDYDLTKYVKLGTYKGIEIDAYTETVTEEDVQKQVLIARSTYATVAEKADAAAKGDQVVIDFVGYMNGKPFDGGSAENYNVMIGSGSMIDGFEDGLIGAKKGDTVTLELAFPSPYLNNPALSGLPVQFVVTVKSVFEQVLPVYDDAFVSEKYGCASVEEFEKTIYDGLVEKNESKHLSYLVQAVWAKIAETTEILEYPALEYADIFEDNLHYYEALAAQEGITLNEYAQKKYGMDVSTFRKAMQDDVYAKMQEDMILYSIARLENITVSDVDYDSGVQKYVDYYGFASKAELMEYFTEEEVRESVLFDKVYEFLAASAVEK